MRFLPFLRLTAAALAPLSALHAQLQWSVFNETATVAAPAATAASGVTVTVPAGQRVTLVATNFTPIDFTDVTSGNVVVTTSFKVSGGLSGIASGTRAIGYGLYHNNGTTADYSDDNGYFTWLNGRQTGSLIELRRRNGNGVSPSLLNPTGTAFNSLGTGATTQTAGVLADGATYAIQLQLIRTAIGVSLGNTSSTTTGAGIWVSGEGLSQTAYTNPDVPPATTRFNELGFMFLNTTASPVTLEILSVTGLTPTNPPAIVTQPISLILNPGQAGALSVEATGTAPLAFQWRKDGVNLAGATNATLALAATANSDAGSYTVVVTNGLGNVTSNPATITVTTAAVPATITTPPASLTITAGQPASFSVTAFGSAPLTYQWFRNGTALPGATTSTIGFPTSTTTAGGDYTVVVANATSSVTSAAATLTVQTLPVISGSPGGATLNVGQAVTFTVTASGNPAPTLQWLKNGVPIPGATNPTLTFASLQLADTGLYAVRATNAVGTTTSVPFFLAIPSTMRAVALAPANGATAVNIDTPLRLTFDRLPVIGNAGVIRIHRATDGVAVDTIDLRAPFHLRTVGNGPTQLSYLPLTVAGNTVTLYPRGGALAYGQSYYVTVEPGALRDTTGASFTGLDNFSAWRFTTKAAGPAANATTLTVAADGSGDFTTVQGAIDAVPAANNQRVLITVKRGTYFEQVYVASNRPLLTVRGEDRAQTVITYPNNNNLNGSTRTRGVFTTAANDFTLETLTIFNSTPQGGSQAEAFVCDGLRVLLNRVTLRSRQDTLLCNTGSTFIADSYIEGNTDFIWGTAAAYFHRCELKALDTAGGEGFYTQVRNGQNQVGFVFADCRLTGEPTAARYYLGRIDPNPGNFPFSQAVYLNCAMGPHILPVGWQLNNATTSATVQDWEFQSTDLTGATLDVRARHASSRQIDANTAAQYRNPAFVLGGWSPQIPAGIETAVPSTSFVNGSNAQLTVQATGVPAPAVQWLWNGALIPGATNATFFLPAISSADTGEYRAVVTGGGVSVTSAPAVITVRPGPFAGVYFSAPVAPNSTVFNVAFYVRDDSSAIFLAHGGNSGLMSRNAFVDAAGNFDFRTLGSGGVRVKGRIAGDGSFAGDFGGIVFNGRREPADGPARALAGYYLTGMVDTPHIVSIVVGASGRAYFLLEAATTWDGGSGQLASGTTFNGSTGGFGIVTATIAPDGSSATARVAYNGGTLPGPFITRGGNDRLAPRQRLAQLSSRVQVGSATPAIAGFVVRGDAPVPILLRAVGPTLGAAFSVPGFLPNPRLELFRGSDRIAANTGWTNAANAGDIAQAAARGGAFALPAGSPDSALLLTLAPGAYTGVVSSASATTSGTALLEVYDLSDGTSGQRLVNLSTRGTVGGANVLIAGLSISSSQPKRVLLRALGPALSGFGIVDAVARPVLSLYRGSALVVSNENWRADINTSNTAVAGDEIGLFRLVDADSTLLVNLPAGNYTAVVSGAGGTTGTALVEVYELP
jgi:pectin methylesterase-like acyl-CoA thioesterase